LDDSTLFANERKGASPDLAGDLGYRGYLSAVRVPTVNFYNEDDFALQSGRLRFLGKLVNWYGHQGDKPYQINGRGITYAYRHETPGLYLGARLQREVTDIHESMALIARSRTKAVGAQGLTAFSSTGMPLGIFTSRLNLQDEAYGFTNDAQEHSAQFNRPIQRQLMPLFTRVIDFASPSLAP
jgi:hypothetical protein